MRDYERVMDPGTIAIIALGGTIAMTGKGGANIAPKLEAKDLVSAVPELFDIAPVITEQLVQKASCALTLSDVWFVSRRIHTLVSEGCSGVVIIQGTDAIEETAFALDCLLNISVPVIVTGAMRNPSQPGADGPANLIAAVRAASSSEAASMNVLVVFDGELHAARHVQKCDTVKGNGFSSPYFGPVGRVVEDRVLFHCALPSSPTLVVEEEPISSVPLIFVGLGDDKDLVKRFYDEKCRGLVLAGLGGGHVPPMMVGCLDEISRKIPVVLTSRVPGGQVLQKTYGYPGGEVDLLSRGLLSAGWLHPLKAKILLGLYLYSKSDREEFRDILKAFDGG